MFWRNLAAVALAVQLAGCASATRGWHEQISIASTPSGAEATIIGAEMPLACVTPCVVQVKRADDISVTFNKPGYEPQVVVLTRELATGGAAGFAGNLLLGGVVGMAVDGVSSAALDHKPNPVIVTLHPIAPPPPPPPVRPARPSRKPQGPTT